MAAEKSDEPEKLAETVKPFDSLSAMKTEHSELMQATRGEATDEVMRRTVTFLKRGVETGKRIDDPADRRLAQGFLDYWKGSIYSQARDVAQTATRSSTIASIPKAILAEYVGAPVDRLIEAGDTALNLLPSADQEIARRILLRLVHLDQNKPTVTLIPLPRAVLENFGVTAQVDRVLASLAAAGILRITPGKTPAEDRVELASEPLVRNWPRLDGWLKRRLALRTAALLWKENPTAVPALTGVPLAEATSYQDKNLVEDDFVKASFDADKRSRQWRNLYLVLIALGALIGPTVFVFQEKAKRQAAETWLLRVRAAEAEGKLVSEEKALRVALFVRLVRLAGDHVVATESEMRLLDWEWEDFSEQYAKNTWLNEFMTTDDRKEQIKRLRLLSTSRSARGVAALDLAHELRKKAFQENDQDLIELMTAVRESSYQRAQKVAGAIRSDAESGKPYQEVQPYVNEFWRLYWSSLGMVENSVVAGAMKDVGDLLKLWEREADAKNNPQAIVPPAALPRLSEAIAQLIRTLSEEKRNVPLRPRVAD